MAEGRVPEDLFYGISVVTIPMPGVRERDGDIQLLAKVLLQRFASEQSRNVNFCRAALDAIEEHSWPGNVREMENRIKRASSWLKEPKLLPRILSCRETENLTA
jgi:two-component system NtrC family response regulator